jgi:hypothetical protein
MLGDSAHAAALLNGAPALKSLIAGTDCWSTQGTCGGDNSDGSMVIALKELVANLSYHKIENYGTDLNLTPPAIKLAPGLADDLMMIAVTVAKPVYMKMLNATVQADGSIVTPFLTLSNNASGQVVLRQTASFNGLWGTVDSGGVTTINDASGTGLPLSFSYASPDKTTYSGVVDPATEQFSSMQVNENNGGSYQIAYDLANKSPWTLNATFYKGSNDKGATWEIAENLDAGGSQIEYVNPSSTIATQFGLYVGVDGQGLPIQVTINWVAGGSQIQTFANLPPGYTKELRNYAGPNGTGKLLSTQYVK